MTADKDLVSGISQENLMARIDYLRMQMLGAQKELGASIEGGSVQPWPELFDQVAELQQYLAMVMTDLRILERRRLGQTLIEACFPSVTNLASTYAEDYDSIAVACHNAIVRSVTTVYSTNDNVAVVMRCVLDSQSDRQIFLDMGIRSSIIEIRFENCRSVDFTHQSDNAHWGGERIVSWEHSEPVFDGKHGYSVSSRIRGVYGTVLELKYWRLRITEVLG